MPNIFIGSSREGKKVTEKVIEQLKGFADCRAWTEAFEIGKSNFDNLTGQIAFYDYAILIATADDVITSRKKQQKTGRDNVLFEFGLFSGGLGHSKVFYILEKNTKIPSDLTGITLPFVPNRYDPNFDIHIKTCVDEIKKHILNKEKTFDLGFLPSTALAYGYFSNFIVRTVERLLEDKVKKKNFSLAGNRKFQIQDLKFTILIPNDLSDDMFSKVKAKRLKDGWGKLNVVRKEIRDYDFSVDISKAVNGELHLVDIPFTLNALNKAVELYSKKQHIGKTVKEQILEEREIRNFKRTLEYLINGNAFTKGIVNVEIVDI
ncbi:STING domain-containing protein [Confluentibacter flavum]|uniref:STING domain-containing protein n=1 Tax=Confluentibacter flavum TaxID=1909700 RepID=UPI0012FEBB88|nr:STING domain-containing protein [Confluentibacter flavum]